MLIPILQSLFERDLGRLKAEIELYHDEKNLWLIDKDIYNSAGNLCLHLIGNLNAFIGAELGKTGFIRHRDLEFSIKDVARQELLDKIEATIGVIKKSLAMVTQEQLETDYPVMVFKEKCSTGLFLIHLATHLNYHLGQINYHWRLLDKKE